MRVKAPDNPQRIACDEPPKSDHPSAWSLGTDEPGRDHRDHHSGPLHKIDVFQASPPSRYSLIQCATPALASELRVGSPLKPWIWRIGDPGHRPGRCKGLDTAAQLKVLSEAFGLRFRSLIARHLLPGHPPAPIVWHPMHIVAVTMNSCGLASEHSVRPT